MDKNKTILLLQQQIEALEHDLESWKERTDKADQKIEDMKKENEEKDLRLLKCLDTLDEVSLLYNLQVEVSDNFKCCGNCKYYRQVACMEREPWEKTYECNVCPKWQSDGLSKKEREV